MFHPRDELEIFSYLIRPESKIGLEIRHWIMTTIISGGFINLVCRGNRVAEEVREFLYEASHKLVPVHIFETKAISEFNLRDTVESGEIAVVDRFEEASTSEVDMVIHARRSARGRAGIICITEVDDLFTVDETFEDIRFSEMAVSGFYIFLVEDYLLSGIEIPAVKDTSEVFQHLLKRFGIEGNLL